MVNMAVLDSIAQTMNTFFHSPIIYTFTSSFILQTNQLLVEKDDHIEQLQDRVKTLEQRGHNEALSGDERIQALEKEVGKDYQIARPFLEVRGFRC